jgi:hypothetical protein
MPPSPNDVIWSDRCRQALSRYIEPLARSVAALLVRPRTNQPLNELLDKAVATLTNPPVIDRRIRDLPESSRKLLALIGLSHQPRWKVEHLLTLLAALGYAEGFAPVQSALEAGLLFPVLTTDQQVESFTAVATAEIFTHPAVATRACGVSLDLPDLAKEEQPALHAIRTADGLDWPLRLAAVWQQVQAAPIRLTQANLLFKKDLHRLQADDVLSTPPMDLALCLPDVGVLALLWAAKCGLLTEHNGELSAATFPTTWEQGILAVLIELVAALPRIDNWNPLLGYNPTETGLSPTPTAGLLIFLLLAAAHPDRWVVPTDLARWLWDHHDLWTGSLPPSAVTDQGTEWVQAYLLGIAFPLQLIEVAENRVRLTRFGRHVFAGAPAPLDPPSFPQTLFVQPNAEILVYRQGLNPAVIATLSRFARWKGLGPACTLELSAEQTYRALESGMTLPMMSQTLTQYSTRPVPPAVIDLLQRWASKRERITVFSSAVLVEFTSSTELDQAINRGIVALRLTDRIGMTASGGEPGLAQLRLLANRDYEAKPQRCVTVDEDGVTLSVDAAAADLLLDVEIGRFASPLPPAPPTARRYRLDPDLLRRAAESLSLAEIDAWFTDRTGQPLSPAGRLFLLGPQLSPPMSARLTVIRFPTPELTDGVLQWPDTRRLIRERLGPTAVVVELENMELLRKVLSDIGIAMV